MQLGEDPVMSRAESLPLLGDLKKYAEGRCGGEGGRTEVAGRAMAGSI